MANNLYGNNFIKMLRSSGYKSTIMAMAEIVDNSVDAKSTNIDIVFVERSQVIGQSSKSRLDKIVFIDNGSGMNEEVLNKCLTFAEGEGRSNHRIGAFGVGLPNSSISVGNRVDVYSREMNSEWNYVFLDVEEQLERAEASYDKAKRRDPSPVEIGLSPELLEYASTVVIWSAFDKLDAAKSDTFVERGEKLFGRIYRYAIQDGLKIRLLICRYENSKPTKIVDVIPNDPLFLMTGKNYITEELWQAAESEQSEHPELGRDDEEFTARYHYKKFVRGCKRNETSLPLFQKCDKFHDVTSTLRLNGKDYKWNLKASFAFKSISNPGLRNGGGTKLGMEIGKKMTGDKNYPSANIFFIRANREIDFGNFGLYTVSDPKNRFWTIEVHFDSELDELMGISNSKQSVDFKYVSSDQINSYHEFEKKEIGDMRLELYCEISRQLLAAIKEMRGILSQYATQYKSQETAALASKTSGEFVKIPVPETPILDIYARNSEWDEGQVQGVTTFLQERFPQIPKEEILKQVTIFSKGQTKTFVLYCPNQSNEIFEQTEIRGKLITLINTNHIFYRNIIEPLKSNPSLRAFTISLELLVSVLALEIENLKLEDENKNKGPLDDLLYKLSYNLNKFIRDKDFEIKAEDYAKSIDANVDSDEEFLIASEPDQQYSSE